MTGEIRESTTLSRCDFSLFKGIYNKIIFNIKSNDNIDITTFPNLYLYFIKNEEVIYKGTLVKERHYYVFDDVMQKDMDFGTYEYVVTTDTNGVLYADQNFSVRGFFQVKKGIPEVIKPVTKFEIDKQKILGKYIYKSIPIEIPYNEIGENIVISSILPLDCSVKIYGTLESSPTMDMKLWDIVYEDDILVSKKIDTIVRHKLQYMFLEIEPLNQTVGQILPQATLDSMPETISVEIF
jgi:hypothetical protein